MIIRRVTGSPRATAIRRRFEGFGLRIVSSGLLLAGRLLCAWSVLLAATLGLAGADEASKDQRQWWIDRYGLIDPRSEPLVARADTIFDRVAAAADKKGNRPPKLVVIGGTGDPQTLTIRDGSVIMTLESLQVCYRHASDETGDSRLAFLIGHELAHLAKDDFWHSNAFAAVSSYQDDAQVRRILTRQLEKTGGSLDFVKTQELQADSYGILYMTMAGYDPQAIIGPGGTNFFRFWESQIAGPIVSGDATHVSADARTEFVRTELQQVVDALDRFGQGVQLYRDGRYEDALLAFESFNEKYPGREVYNALGASHLQLAVQPLAGCSGTGPAPQLPIVLDLRTTARRLHLAPAGDAGQASAAVDMRPAGMHDADPLLAAAEQGGAAPCPKSDGYRANLQAAVRFLDIAVSRDPRYLPARINLSTALILSGDHAKAISLADDALKLDPGNAFAAATKALAERLFTEKTRPAGLLPADRSAAAGTSSREQTASPAPRMEAGLALDAGNFSMGLTLLWWPTDHLGLQVSYGQGLFTSYSIRGLARFGALGQLTPYAGIGLLSVERRTGVLGVDTRFAGTGGEAVAGAILPLSGRLSLLAAASANTVKLDRTVNVQDQNIPATMTYSPLSFTACLLYRFD